MLNTYGIYFMINEESREKIEEFIEFLRLCSNREITKEEFLEFAELELREANYNNALYYTKKAISIDDNYIAAWNTQGAALRNLHEFVLAMFCYDKALECAARLNMHDLDWRIYYNKGLILLNYENNEFLQKAIECFDQSIKLNAKYALVYKNKGSVLVKQGNFVEAIACFDKVIELGRNNLGLYHKGKTYFALGDHQEAIKCLDECLKINPENTKALLLREKFLNDLLQKFESDSESSSESDSVMSLIEGDATINTNDISATLASTDLELSGTVNFDSDF